MKWLRADTKLPEDDTPVLVAVYRYGKFKRICLGRYDAGFQEWYDYEAWQRDDDYTSFNRLTGEVMFWQPLPEPPESEETDVEEHCDFCSQECDVEHFGDCIITGFYLSDPHRNKHKRKCSVKYCPNCGRKAGQSNV